MKVIEARANNVGAPLVVFGPGFRRLRAIGPLDRAANEDRLLDLPLPALARTSSDHNAGTAIAAAVTLPAVHPDLAIDEAAIEKGLRTVEWPARMQRLMSGPLPEILGPECELWLDGGHNPAAGDMLADTLVSFEEKAPKPTYLVVGMMGQKDALGFLAPFRGLVRAIYTVPIPGAHEAPHIRKATWPTSRVRPGSMRSTRPGIAEALEAIAALPPGDKRVLICGSLYLAGHVLALQQGTTAQSN